MAVKLRMTRIGRRHKPFFRINVIDGRAPRDGKVIEKIGHYDPLEKDADKQIVLNIERVKYWLDKGAIPSDSVSQILLRKGISSKYAEQEKIKRQKAKKIARTRGKFFTKAERIAAQKAKEEEEKAKAEKAKAEQKEAKAKEVKAEETKAEPRTAKAEKEKPEKKEKAQAEEPEAEQGKAEAEGLKSEEAKAEETKPQKQEEPKQQAEEKPPKKGKEEKTEKKQ